MSTVRDIIVEAASRANVCPRKRALPEDIFVDSLMLFDGVMQEFSANDYVTAYQNEVDFNPIHESVLVGEGEDVEVEAKKIQLPKRVLYRHIGQVDWIPMDFQAYDNFYSAAYSDYIVSWQPTGRNQFKLYFKPRFVCTQPQCKLIYNLEMIYKDDDVISLPTPYIELITRALAYKMAVKWPRVDESKKAGLLKEFEDLEASIKATNASNRIITRGGHGGGSLRGDFLSGAFISNRYF